MCADHLSVTPYPRQPRAASPSRALPERGTPHGVQGARPAAAVTAATPGQQETANTHMTQIRTQTHADTPGQTTPSAVHSAGAGPAVASPARQLQAARTHTPCTRAPSGHAGCPGCSHPTPPGKAPSPREGPAGHPEPIPSPTQGPAGSLPTGTPRAHPLAPRQTPRLPTAATGHRSGKDRNAPAHAHAAAPLSTGDRPSFSPAPPPLPKTDTPLEGRPEKIRREPLFTDSEKEV